MAKKEKINISRINRLNKKTTNNIGGLLKNMEMSIYGATSSSEVETLDTVFDNILNNELNVLNSNCDGDVTSFITRLASNNDKIRAKNEMSTRQLENYLNSNEQQVKTLFDDAYRNRLLKYNDLHEVSSQLNELREAILITRDAIIASDIVEGNMSRTLNFSDNNAAREVTGYVGVVEGMEKRFKLQEKVKNFIIPKTLEYGEYYAYVIPYSKIFSDFSAYKRSKDYVPRSQFGNTLFESAGKDTEFKNKLIENLVGVPKKDPLYTDLKNEAVNEVNQILKNITISNEPMPLCFLEDGTDISDFITEATTPQKKSSSKSKKAVGSNPFETINSATFSDAKEGVIKSGNGKAEDFSEIRDCYIKLVDPTHILEVRVLNEIIGYYYIQDADTADDIYNGRYDKNDNGPEFIRILVEKIVQQFDKKYLVNNIKFKNLIADALNYYNLKEKRIRFQYIPVEYVQRFKINEDENGRGTSVVEPALFYAKLYLMLLLFKMVTIVSNSNDTKMYYIRSSGLDKNVTNQLQEIGRKLRSRQITIPDMFSYTSLVNKVNAGSSIFVPTGANNERGIETEILQGQDVSLNTDFMEFLRTNYISATGVPAVIMNSIHEADFAKSVEIGNTRFQQRIISNQLDFNPDVTELYKKIMSFSTNIPPDVIESFTFEFNPPKATNNTIKQDMIGNFESTYNFLLSLFIDEEDLNSNKSNYIKREFKKRCAKRFLPMLGIDELVEDYKDCKIVDNEDELKPPEANEADYEQ